MVFHKIWNNKGPKLGYPFVVKCDKCQFFIWLNIIILAKIILMRGESNTIIYIIAGIILLHFVVGFIWLAYKLSKKKEDK